MFGVLRSLFQAVSGKSDLSIYSRLSVCCMFVSAHIRNVQFSNSNLICLMLPYFV